MSEIANPASFIAREESWWWWWWWLQLVASFGRDNSIAISCSCRFLSRSLGFDSFMYNETTTRNKSRWLSVIGRDIFWCWTPAPRNPKLVTVCKEHDMVLSSANIANVRGEMFEKIAEKRQKSEELRESSCFLKSPYSPNSDHAQTQNPNLKVHKP